MTKSGFPLTRMTVCPAVSSQKAKPSTHPRTEQANKVHTSSLTPALTGLWVGFCPDVYHFNQATQWKGHICWKKQIKHILTFVWNSLHSENLTSYPRANGSMMRHLILWGWSSQVTLTLYSFIHLSWKLKVFWLFSCQDLRTHLEIGEKKNLYLYTNLNANFKADLFTFLNTDDCIPWK